jgi:hypothetical protein
LGHGAGTPEGGDGERNPGPVSPGCLAGWITI